MPATQHNRDMEIITPLGTDVLLLKGVQITETLGRLFTINVELASTENITFDDLLGQNVSISLTLPSGKRFFNGIVSSISQVLDEGRYARYKATIKPWLWLLTRTSDCRVFQHISVPELIKKICKEQGYTDIKDKLSSSYRLWEYCVQYRENDFNFISRLMEQEGIYYYFTHEEGKHTLNLADGPGSHELIPDHGMIPFYPPDNVAFRDEECIFSWQLQQQLQSGVFVLNDYDFLRPKADLKADAHIDRKHQEAQHELYDYPGEYTQNSDGDDAVQIRIEARQTQYEQAQGKSIVRGLCYGGLFTLSEYPRDDQNREYLVIATSHQMQLDDIEAGGSGGGSAYSNTFTVVDSKTAYRSISQTQKTRVKGPQTAVVVGPKGEEIYTNEHGQVKLQFHWDRYGKFDENSSCWVRVSQLWAGKGWGGIHIPRIGQEVIVEFLEGDPDRPIITGRVYNAEQTPPYALPANKTRSGIKSRSSKNGSGANFNELRFEDKKGAEEIYIHAEKDQNNLIEHDETTKIGRNLLIDVGEHIVIRTGKASITMKKDGTITIAGKDISIEGSGKIDITASQTLSLKGQKILINE